MRKLLSISCASGALWICSVTAQGPVPSPLIPPPPIITSPLIEATVQSAEMHELTKPDVEAFLDGLIPAQLKSRDIAGAVVSIVKDGQVVLAKGYGYSDFAGKKPVTADQTLFRPGSISKVFTAIAVMQLVEQGNLDLDRDVNDYLDFSIPKTYAEPITLRRILTHTAGFEETVKNLFVPSEREMKPLRDYLVAAMPERIFPPGKVPAYSNYALSIAGYIVQKISGEQFEDYLAKHIFQPLKMERSTFAQPLPSALAPLMAKGYMAATGAAKPFEFVQAAPAGALSATAADMGRFMATILQDGTLEGVSILKPESVHAMEAREFKMDPSLRAIGLVLMEYSTSDPRIVGHGGDTIYFHSDMFLLPEAHVGVFISYNSAGSRFGGGRGEVMRAFLDRYFPGNTSSPPPLPKSIAQNDGHAVSGMYQVSRRGESSFLKLGAMLGEAAVRSDQEGVLTLEGDKNLRGALKRWEEIAPLVYREIDGHDIIAFRRDADGIVRTMFPAVPIFEWERVSWFENKMLLAFLIGGSLFALETTVLLWPIAALVRRRYKSPLFTNRTSKIFFASTRLVALLQIAVVVMIAILLSRAGTNIALLGDGMNPWLYLLHAIGWIASMGTIVVVFAAIHFWRTQSRKWLRLHATLLAIAGLIFTWFAWHWHLLDASIKF